MIKARVRFVVRASPAWTRRLSLFVAASLVALIMGDPRIAAAQTVALAGAPNSLGWLDAKGASVMPRPAANYPYGVSLSDCQNDYRITFPVTATGFAANESLEVWAGPLAANCADDAQRGAATGSQTCWKVSPSVSPAPTQTLSIAVRDIIASPTTLTQDPVAQDASICGKVDFSTFHVFFILTSGGAAQASAKQDVIADTIGPPAIPNVVIASGDRNLVVDWPAVAASSSNDASQIAVYYEVASANSACSAPELTTTTHGPDVGTVITNATNDHVEIDDLSNGNSYAVGVALEDAFFNDGPHAIQCASPIAGGTPPSNATGSSSSSSGGGGCAISQGGAALGGLEGSTTAICLGALVVGACASRRKRSRGDCRAERPVGVEGGRPRGSLRCDP